jgi:hypothetical protein
MKKTCAPRSFLFIGVVGLAVGCILFGTTLYQFSYFTTLAYSQKGGVFGSGAFNSGYLHYGILIALAAVLMALGAALVYRNIRVPKTKRTTHGR